ncbi:hypothetical protein ACJIZ3_011643 [Penstemon smallii]|uniref:Beta-glucosidase n=1 Tax=Penstemon smallii TaxID=265156 RepID=A0ABD3ULC9_9LAMI
MTRAGFYSLLLLLFPVTAALYLAAAAENYSRSDFPADFVFGSGTGAYQYEGAAFEDGRAPSIWDTFAHSGHVNGVTGDVACDGYHKYKDDVKLMSDTGLEAFRISLSWSRLIPNGRGPVNPLGLQYYNKLIDDLISHGIQPHVTLHHLDLPQALESEYGGWLNRKIVKDFTAYADVCFREFGDRVSFWTTVNEANIFATGGYSEGLIAPGRCSPSIRTGCFGNSSTEPYIVGHNILLAHSATWKLYRKKYKATQKGYVGFSIYTWGMVPYSNAKEDIIATQRLKDFIIGWLIDPLIFGDYPEIVKRRAKGRIPALTKYESKQTKGSFDFIGLNFYMVFSVEDDRSLPDFDKWNFWTDVGVKIFNIDSGNTPPDQLPVMPWGLSTLLEYIKQVYGNPPIYIHENGQSLKRNGTLNDTPRVEYLRGYIGGMLDAIRNGSNTKGYFAWSFLDCLELDGYEHSFGLYYVDLDDAELKRYQKLSAIWYSNFLKGSNAISEVGENVFVSLK